MGKYIDKFKDFSDNMINEHNDNDILKIDRKNILNYVGHNDWSVFLRKLNNFNFFDFRSKFEDALRHVKVSMDFIEKYKDLKVFQSVISNILMNKEYTEDELINIIEKYPEYIDWYYIFYNENIPIWYKKQNYDKIYNDSLKNFDNSVPMHIRKENTEKALSVLKVD